MKQVIQNLRSGVLELLDIPCPQVSRGKVLIASRCTVISAGTERMLVEFGKANLIAKARQQPDRVKQVLDKIRSDGLLPTLEAVFSKLDEPLPLGYCNAGVVLEVGAGITDLKPGDRVASNGGHAEIVLVPRNLCARIPDSVSDEDACFAVLASIALQGVRLLQPNLGEVVAVFGLGLVGLLTVQLLRANGVRVLAIDMHPQRLSQAELYGAQTVNLASGSDPVTAALQMTQHQGVDGVIIAASAKDDDIINQAAEMTRQRGRVIQVGATRLHLNRAAFYEKEIAFQVSCSYGPGRYDATYEQEGRDYPYGFVRWTEQRNIMSTLELMEQQKLDVGSLITSRIPHAEAQRAYDLVSRDRSQLGIVLQYGQPTSQQRTEYINIPNNVHSSRVGRVTIGFVGAGSFTKGVLLPAFCHTPAKLECIASASGLSATHAARKFGISASTSNYRHILENDRINTVVITTRHNQHASMVAEALAAGKHVFVEKPLAIDTDGISLVKEAYSQANQLQLAVGFNRRFAPLVRQLTSLLQGRQGPLCMIMQVNAGAIPSDHWAHDPIVGGGRIIGEGCHWLDLLTFLTGSTITTVQSQQVGENSGAFTCDDHISISLKFADGSIGTIHYFANGHRSYPKEKLTVYSHGRVMELDNFRVLQGYGCSNFRKKRLFRQDKGHRAEVEAFVERIGQGGPPLIPVTDLWHVSQAAIDAASFARGETRRIDGESRE